MEDDVEEDGYIDTGYIDMDTWKITLPMKAYRCRNLYRVMAVLPILPWVWRCALEFSSGHRFNGVMLSFMTILCACVGWIFYSGIVRRMEFGYLSHAYISKLLVDDAFREEQSARARAAADVAHAANRKRIAEARELYEGREWPTKAAAARALAAKFNVTSKTAERWISSWGKA